MKNRPAALADRRRVLLEKIEAQRVDVAGIFLGMQKHLTLADAGLNAARFMRNHPGWVAGGIAALLSLRGKGIAGMARKGWRLVYLYPAAIAFGWKYLTAFRSPRAEQPSAGDPEQLNSGVDHSRY
jgi:hypothetical protein